MTLTEGLLFLTAGLLLFAVVLLMILLGRQGRGEAAARQQINDLGNALLDAVEDESDASQAALRDMSGQMLNQLSAMGGQMIASAGGQESRMAQMQTAMEQSLSRQEDRMARLQETNERQLSDMRRTVDEKLTDTLNRRLGESFSQVSAQLERVYTGLGEMQTLAAGVGDLKKVLTNVKTRGTWGETQLAALLEAVLSPEQYAVNVEVVPGSGERVEFAIRLPGQGQDPVWLPVDSKFPQEDYLRMADAAQAGDRRGEEAARKTLCQQLRKEARTIAEKYISPPYSTDFAVMFLPVESLYAEAVRDPELTESLQREYRVVTAGPSTFAALLNSLQLGFRTLAVSQRSAEIWRMLGTVREDFGRFGAALEQARLQLDKAGETLDTACRDSRRIEKHLARLESGEE